MLNYQRVHGFLCLAVPPLRKKWGVRLRSVPQADLRLRFWPSTSHLEPARLAPGLPQARQGPQEAMLLDNIVQKRNFQPNKRAFVGLSP